MKNKPSSKNMTIAVAALAFIICFSAGFFAGLLFYTEGKIEKLNTTKSGISYEENNNGDTNDEKTTNQTIQPSTEIILIRRYSKSESINIVNTTPNEHMYNMDEKTFSETYTEWEVYGFSSEKVTLYKVVDSYSPDTYKLAAYNDGNGEVIAVFGYDEDGKEYLIRKVSTPISMLSDADAQKIREGIYVKGKNALDVLLENYDE